MPLNPPIIPNKRPLHPPKKRRSCRLSTLPPASHSFHSNPHLTCHPGPEFNLLHSSTAPSPPIRIVRVVPPSVILVHDPAEFALIVQRLTGRSPSSDGGDSHGDCSSSVATVTAAESVINPSESLDSSVINDSVDDDSAMNYPLSQSSSSHGVFHIAATESVINRPSSVYSPLIDYPGDRYPVVIDSILDVSASKSCTHAYDDAGATVAAADSIDPPSSVSSDAVIEIGPIGGQARIDSVLPAAIEMESSDGIISGTDGSRDAGRKPGLRQFPAMAEGADPWTGRSIDIDADDISAGDGGIRCCSDCGCSCWGKSGDWDLGDYYRSLGDLPGDEVSASTYHDQYFRDSLSAHLMFEESILEII